MIYTLLGQNLHDTADRARRYFADNYGATRFRCEEAIDNDLPLKPTWSGVVANGYVLCIEVRETPFSESLYQFVTLCLHQGKPVRLWVAIPQRAESASFKAELKRAHEAGVGVVEIGENGGAHEFYKPVPLSLGGLRKTNLSAVPAKYRAQVKDAEDTFLSGSPAQACQDISQHLEDITRKFAEHSYKAGWWRHGGTSGKQLSDQFFRRSAWAGVLEQLDERIETQRVRKKAPRFSRARIGGARQLTDWRNTVSHKPTTPAALRTRDERLRTMFEATRDLLLEWYEVVKPLKL